MDRSSPTSGHSATKSPQNHRHSTQRRQTGMITPTTLTPHGDADTGCSGDYWPFNTNREPVRTHKQYRKTLNTPSRRTQSSFPTGQLEDYSRTTTRFKDGTTATFDDRRQTTNSHVYTCVFICGTLGFQGFHMVPTMHGAAFKVSMAAKSGKLAFQLPTGSWQLAEGASYVSGASVG